MTQAIVSWVKYWPVLMFIWMAYQTIVDNSHEISVRLAIMETKTDAMEKAIEKCFK